MGIIMKKILVITHQLSRTGAPIVLLDMVRLCLENGYSIDMITMLDGELGADVRNMGINYTIQDKFFSNRKEFMEKANQYNLVIANTLITYEAIHVLNGLRIPVIWWLHEGRQYFDYFKTVLPDFSKLSGNIHVRSVGHYVSDVVKDIYNVDTDILHFAIEDEKSNVNEMPRSNKIRFLTSGTYSFVKAQDVLAKAIQLLPDSYMNKVEFLFCGNETMVDENVFNSVKSLEEKYDNVTLLHQLSHSEVLSYMKSSDCLIVPSRVDPIPTVAVEMFMVGQTCLCTDVCGIAHYIKDGVNGFTVPPENPQALCDKICQIVDMAGTSNLDNIRHCGRLIYEKHFSKSVVEPKIMGLIQSLIGLPEFNPLPKTFLNEEIRDGYTVTTTMKKVWKVELEILTMFDEFCNEHGLHYIIDYGTLLGAVRHKGFIPWDDDIDVVMLRDDYEKLKSIANEYLTSPYFYQNMHNDQMLFGFAKIRNSNTSAIEFTHIGKDFNQGIFIDIFPLDSVPYSIDEPTPQTCIQSELLQIVNDPKSFLEKIQAGYHPTLTIDLIQELIKMSPRDVFNQYEQFSLGKFGYTKYVGYLQEQLGTHEAGMPLEWYTNVVYLPFENIMLPAPKEYEKVLINRYGSNFMEFPKESQRGNWHNIHFDADKPFTYYMENHFLPD